MRPYVYKYWRGKNCFLTQGMKMGGGGDSGGLINLRIVLYYEANKRGGIKMKKKSLLLWSLVMVLCLSLSVFAFASDESVNGVDAMQLLEEVAAYLAEAAVEIDMDAVIAHKQEVEPPEIALNKYMAEMEKLQNYLSLSNAEMSALQANRGLNLDKIELLMTKVEAELNALSQLQVSDEKKIEEVLNKLFWLQGVNYIGDNEIDLSVCMAHKDKLTLGQNFFLEYAKYHKYLVNRLEAVDPRHNEIEKCEIVVNGDRADVKLIVDEYSIYDIGGGFTGHSWWNYSIKMIKENDRWLVDDIRSDFEIESIFIDNGIYFLAEEKIQADEKHKDAKQRIDVESLLELRKFFEMEEAALLEPRATASYDRTTAANYALDHARTADYSKIFRTDPGGNDCQNFVSQSIYMGFGGNHTSASITNREWPMFITPTDRAWWNNGSNMTDPWAGVGRFYDMSRTSNSSNQGPYASFTNHIFYAELADKIDVHDGSRWFHTYIVTSVTGTSGNRTQDQIWVSAHTTDRRDEKLSAVWVYPDYDYYFNTRTGRIGSYYF